MREREGKTIGEKVEIRRFGKGYGDRGERVKRRELGERDASGEEDKKGISRLGRMGLGSVVVRE